MKNLKERETGGVDFQRRNLLEAKSKITIRPKKRAKLQRAKEGDNFYLFNWCFPCVKESVSSGLVVPSFML